MSNRNKDGTCFLQQHTNSDKKGSTVASSWAVASASSRTHIVSPTTIPFAANLTHHRPLL